MSVYLSDMGIACTLGCGKAETAKALFRSEAKPLFSEQLLLSKKTVPVGRIPFDLPALPDAFNFLDSRNNRLLKLVLDEIRIAVESCKAKFGRSRIGVIMATSTSGMSEQEEAFLHKLRTGELLSNYHESQAEIASPSLFASAYLGVHGPSYTISTACTSSAKALCSAKRLITSGICDAVVVGGVDTLCRITLNGFDSLGLISEGICNPFSKNRAGITIGEGAAVFLAMKEGNVGSVELSGCGESSDAHHISCPDPEGSGTRVAIDLALKQAGLMPADISYINLHGTGTLLNDSMESTSTLKLFGEKVLCSSTKALTGHTLGAAGAIEAAFLWLALKHEKNGKIPLPRHVWDNESDENLPDLNFTKYGECASPINGAYALMSNSFAFGGSNVSIILKKQADAPMQEILPHDHPMILIDRVVSFDGDSIRCQVEIEEHSSFCEKDVVPSYIAMEYMAQTIAAWSGLMSRSRGEKPKLGFLLGTRHLDLNISNFESGQVLDIYGKLLYKTDEMASFECHVDLKGREVARAKMNVFQPNEIGERGISE